MKKEQSIRISKERRAELIAAIRDFYSREREEEIGELAAGLLPDFIMESSAPEFYNQGVDDACRLMKESAEDLLSLRA
ncbi:MULTISPECIES: DUF2164 domain-containing protein [unclassified Methanoregula]|uniref:DUF2164 domain-containing protein n=1 Tax=unclassified Methanoregula TaxID=2649730 RepID=UPI0009CD42C2|nr:MULTISPECIES: DUF2164 domain-containing protein [unclassified Methanoregula]OPX65324.1 MAG: hypothetical protein A4E33_00357 [Methanoregula sp. PtaB.Bin085]OPY32233.1 MAG: hypothetical protein A4E34_02607 [Methanoregula sp. PtaU1.Bin006]